MLELTQHGPASDMVKHGVILVGLIRESAVIQEDVLQPFTPLGLGVDTNGDSRTGCVGGHSCRAIGWDFLKARFPVVSERFGEKM
jgi:hypothetical protein